MLIAGEHLNFSKLLIISNVELTYYTKCQENDQESGHGGSETGTRRNVEKGSYYLMLFDNRTR